MQTIFVFAPQSGISNAGKPYDYQVVQIVQSPQRPDVMSRHFISDGAAPVEPGKYNADIYFRDTKTGIRPVFENFKKLPA